MNLKKKRVTVVGLGKSGLACARRLRTLGAQVFVTEALPEEQISEAVRQELANLSLKFEFGGHTLEAIKACDLIVVSPGVHLDLAIFEEAKIRNIPIISEIELAYRILKKPIIAVTGTNGKTTTTTLIAEMLQAGALRSVAAGNIGTPLISIDDTKLDYVVAEISSYQLEGIVDFRPRISVILNITEDHIERHGTFDEYARIKGRIFENQGQSEYLIYNADSKKVRELVVNARTALIPYSHQKKVQPGVYLAANSIFYNFQKRKIKLCAKKDIFLKGEHNVENCLAAVAAAKLCGVPDKIILNVLRGFKGVEHRIEYVTSIQGIDFYNDSKGTNPDSTIVALKALGTSNLAKPQKNIVLILGGRDKGVDLKKLCTQIKKNTKKVVLIGEARRRFAEALLAARYRNLAHADTLEDAVVNAFRFAKKNEVVLLSPACASFDMFKNFEERGQVFKSAVNRLVENEGVYFK